MKEIINVVVPVYNAERYVGKCIRSIQAQSYENWKLILVNDGSTDKTREVLEYYQKKDERITVIYQENKGSVEARKTGVLSEEARNNPYIVLCDADDELPPNALEKMLFTMKYYDAEMVCGSMAKMWRGIRLPKQFISPCFKISEPKVYTNKQILEELYISFFGVSNFPVSLWAKMFQTDMLIKAIDFKPVVHFIGDDLSVTIRVMPKVKKLVIIPDLVYKYRMGGGSSRFIPDLIDDYLSLYEYRKDFINEYSMPQNAENYLNVELLNVTKTHFIQCIRNKEYDKEKVLAEIKSVCAIEQIREAAVQIVEYKKGAVKYAMLILDCDADAIYKGLEQIIKKNRFKQWVKEVLKKL